MSFINSSLSKTIYVKDVWKINHTLSHQKVQDRVLKDLRTKPFEISNTVRI